MTATRIASLGVLFLVAMHLIGQHIWLNESPVWFNGIFLARLILFDGARDVPFWAIGLGFAAAAVLLAWLLWTRQSRFAALVLLAVQLWEAWWRYQQIEGTLSRGHVVGTPMVAGGVMAGIGVAVALLAVWCAFRVRRTVYA